MDKPYTYACRSCEFKVSSGISNRDTAKTLLYQHIAESHKKEFLELVSQNPNLSKYIKPISKDVVSAKCKNCGMIFYAINNDALNDLLSWHYEQDNCSSSV